MGYSTSWIAVKGVDRRQIAEALGWELSEIPAGGRLIHGVGVLPGGWTVVIAPRDQALKPPFLDLAKLGPGVVCFIEEHVMYSEARGFEAGAETWRVIHDAEKGMRDLQVTGAPPAALARIREKAMAEQAEIDETDEPVDAVFDVPPALTREICGFRMDDWPEGIAFQSLQPPARPGLFARLFGRG